MQVADSTACIRLNTLRALLQRTVHPQVGMARVRALEGIGPLRDLLDLRLELLVILYFQILQQGLLALEVLSGASVFVLLEQAHQVVHLRIIFLLRSFLWRLLILNGLSGGSL